MSLKAFNVTVVQPIKAAPNDPESDVLSVLARDARAAAEIARQSYLKRRNLPSSTFTWTEKAEEVAAKVH